MKYSVLWVPGAEKDLADLWTDATDKAGVEQAANYIDHRLEYDPEQLGESRAHGQRILLAAPLGVTFEVLPEDRIVRVLDVWQFKTPS